MWACGLVVSFLPCLPYDCLPICMCCFRKKLKSKTRGSSKPKTRESPKPKARTSPKPERRRALLDGYTNHGHSVEEYTDELYGDEFYDEPSNAYANEHRTIRPDLYQRKDIVLQQASLDGGHGRLHTRLKYDFRTCDLVVHLIEAQDLPVPDPVSGLFSDPYIRISLVPGVDERARQTSVKRKTLNPFFNEYFKFPLDFDDLKDKTLQFNVFDYDKFSRHTPLGDVEIGLGNLDLSTSVEMWADILNKHMVIGESGEILISLSYLPTAERLTVNIMKAKDLKLSTAAPSADPFVRVSLMMEGKKIKRKKTSVRKSCISPVWNEPLSFNVPAEVLPKVSLEVCVLDYDLIGHGDILGRCLLGGTEASGEGLEHWREMLTNQRKSTAMWHVLRK